MEPHRKSLSRMKPILFPQNPASKGKTHLESHYSSEQINAFFLLKYFPKYINEDLEIDLPNGPLNTRLKHIKLIQSLFLYDIKKPHSNYWRLLVANKAKTIQDFKSSSDGGRYRITFSKRTLQKLKLFPGRQEPSLYPLDPADSTESYSSVLHYLERSSSYIGIINNLRILKLNLPSQRLLPLLAKVDNFERILSHLKIFSLELTCNSQEYQLFQALPNYKAVLKYLTSLELGSLARKEFFQVLQVLPKNCHQLCDISFSTSQKEVIDTDYFTPTFDENTCLEDENYLQCLQDFKTLKKLHIVSYHNLDFLQNAKLPSSLQFLHLEFLLFDWECYENFHQTATPFHHSLNNLTDLKTLILCFPLDSGDEPPNKKYLLAKQLFIESLLKNIPRLTRLQIIFYRRYYDDSESMADLIPFNLSHFFECISHLSGSLEVLEIEDPSPFFKFTTESRTASLIFPKLSSLNLLGEISDLDLESILGLASNIQLDKISVESLKKLLDIFLFVGQFKDIEKKQVTIKMDLENLKINSSDENYFKENYKEVKEQIQAVNLKNVSLMISSGANELMFRKEIKSFRDVFGKLDIEHPFPLY